LGVGDGAGKEYQQKEGCAGGEWIHGDTPSRGSGQRVD